MCSGRRRCWEPRTTAADVAATYTQAGIDLLTNVRLCRLVEHVGSVETLITHPASMTHADVPPEHRRRVGIADGLVRLSVGLEEPTDVIADLQQAIARSTRAGDAVEGGAACASRN